MTVAVRSFAKINLGLYIGGARADGYHDLRTVYQTIALHDVIRVSVGRGSGIEIVCTDARVPLDSSNTCYRMAERVMDELGAKGRVNVEIEKRLPVRGGLGAASSNAVATLVALERALKRKLSAPVRLRIAAEVGSDLPLFLVGGTTLGVGRGEEVYPLPDFPSWPCVLALPPIGVSTPQAYRDWDSLQAAAALTGAAPSATITVLSRSIAAAFGEPHSSGVFSEAVNARADRAEDPLLALVRTGIENDFERVVFPQYPFLGEIKSILTGTPGTEDAAVYAGLSGSGSALFGLYPTSAAAQTALVRLERHGVTGLVTSTLPRSDYWRTMMVADAE